MSSASVTRKKTRTSVNHGVLGNDTEFRRVCLDDLEFHCPHSSANKESVSFADGSVGWEDGKLIFRKSTSEGICTFEEIGFEVDIENIAAEALDGVIEGQDVYALAVFDVKTLVDVDEIAELDSQVVTSDLVHLDSTFLNIVGAQTDQHCIASLLSAMQARS